jgi:hypothetical protein
MLRIESSPALLLDPSPTPSMAPGEGAPACGYVYCLPVHAEGCYWEVCILPVHAQGGLLWLLLFARGRVNNRIIGPL